MKLQQMRAADDAQRNDNRNKLPLIPENVAHEMDTTVLTLQDGSMQFEPVSESIS